MTLDCMVLWVPRSPTLYPHVHHEKALSPDKWVYGTLFIYICTHVHMYIYIIHMYVYVYVYVRVYIYI